MSNKTIPPYPSPMLPDVNYQLFDESLGELVELEHGVLQDCQYFLEKLEHALIEDDLIQVPELIVAHLCSYLGAALAVNLPEEAESIEPNLIQLMEYHAKLSFSQFSRYLVGTHQERGAKLQILKANSPGSIVAQTLRLGRIIMDMMARLGSNRKRSVKDSQQKQEEWFCPQDVFMAFLIPLINKQRQDWQERLKRRSNHYWLNQFAIQIAWIIGYFSYLDNQSPEKGRYLSFGLPCITLYREHTLEFLSMMASKNANTSPENKDDPLSPEIKSLLNEVQNLSSKTHAQQPPAITDFQKETAIIHAAIEKQIIELITEGMAIKIIFIGVFHFWFTLDAPLRVDNPKALEAISPFDEMGNIIELVKKTAGALPEPELSPDLNLLNQKMQALKSVLPDPATLDYVPQDVVAKQTQHVLTAIHTLTSDYIKDDYHLEAIANVLFSQWLRLSVFYGVSESDWQKMDFYFSEILTAIRHYFTTLVK